MRQIAIALQNALSLEDVVENINDEINDYGADANTLAAEYAYSACDTDEEYIEDQIEAHLDVLKENGAKFNFQKAKKLAISFFD